MKNLFKICISLLFISRIVMVNGQDVVKDYDGNSYSPVKVGNQIWLAENLRVVHYRNGEEIPNVKDRKQWDALTAGAYCDAGNNPSRSEVQGRIYNWYVIGDERNVCPSGWHVPSEAEWQILVKLLSQTPGTKELNASLFKVLQEDFRGYDGDFSGNGYGGGGWWTSTPGTDETAYFHGVNYNTASKNRLEGRKKFGYSIRCIKD